MKRYTFGLEETQETGKSKRYSFGLEEPPAQLEEQSQADITPVEALVQDAAEVPERKRPTLDVNALIDQGVFESAVPEAGSQFRPLLAFDTAVQEAPGYKLFAKGLRKADEFLGFAPPAPKPEFKPEGAEWLPYLAGKVVGEAPTVAAAYLTGGAGAAALTPEASALIPTAETLSQLAARGAGAGLTHSLFRQAVEPQPLQEAIPNIALETAGFMVGDPAVSWVGKQAKHFLKPEDLSGIRNLDFTTQPPERPSLIPTTSFKSPVQDYAINNAKDFVRGRGFSSVPDYPYPSNYLSSPARSGVRESVTEAPIVNAPDPIMSRPAPKALRTPDYAKQSMDELQSGITEAQNYVQHNDILAAYPPGTTIQQAYADIRANTGIDIPQLMVNAEKAMARPGLRQSAEQQAQYAGLRRAAGLGPEKIGRTGQPPRTLGKMDVQQIEQKYPLPFQRTPEPEVTMPKLKPFERRLPLIPQSLPEAQRAGVYDAGTIGAARFTIPGKGSAIPGTGEKVRSFPVSVARSPMVKDEVKAGLITDIYEGGPGAYKPVTLKGVDKEAQELINKNPEKAVRFVMEAGEPSALHTATGIRLIERFQNANNFDRAIDVAEALAEKLTKQGQAISAARLMGALRPDGVLVFAQRQINKINNGVRLRIPGLSKDIKLTSDDAANLKKLAEAIQKAPDDATKVELSQELQAALNALRPAGIGQKIATTQTIAQLLNPKTQIRNILGNELFYRLERVNKFVATPIDWTLTKLTGKERTVTFATTNQGGYWDGFIKGAKAGWKGVNVKGLQTQYDLGRAPAFKSGPGHNPAERFMSFLERSLGASLKGFDTAAYTRAYNQTLGELATLKAINTTGRADRETVKRFMQEMDTNLLDIADNYGKYVTFQDENLISKGLQKVKRGLNLGQDFGLGDLVLKYPRTPGALLARALEYSPAGFLRAAYQIAKPMFNKQRDNREIVMALSRAITGTVGLTGMGYALADLGIITGKGPDDPDVRDLQRQTGQGPYRVNMGALYRWVTSGFNRSAAELRPGDRFISYDWAAPISVALSIGANMNEIIKGNKEPLENTLTTIGSAIEGGINTVAEQPVLQGVKRLLTTYPGEESGLGRKIGETLSEAPASFTPTLLNQARQFTDNTGRLTYDPDILKQAINKAIVKIPGVSGTLPTTYTTLGQQKETYQDGSNTILNVFLNPAFASRYKVSPEAQLAISTFKQTGETKQVPRVVKKYVVVEGKRFDLTPGEYSELQRIVGQKTAQGFTRIPKGITPEAQIKRMVDVLNDAGQDGKLAILKGRGLNARKKGQGITVSNY